MSAKKTMVVLAGGLGSRYNGLKQVDGILDNGAPLMEYSIYDAIQAGFNKIVVIINKMVPESYLQRLEDILKPTKVELHWVYQNMEDYVPAGYDWTQRQKPWGTSHALLCTKEIVKEPFIVLNADDFYSKDAYIKAAQAIDSGEIDQNHYQLIAYRLEPTLSENGTVSRGVCEVDAEGNLVSIQERTAIAKEDDKIFFTENDTKSELTGEMPVSMNFWVFDSNVFDFIEQKFHEFVENNPGPKDEYFIPAVAQQMIDAGKANFKVKTSTGEWKGVTYSADKPLVQQFLQEQIANNQYKAGLWI